MKKNTMIVLIAAAMSMLAVLPASAQERIDIAQERSFGRKLANGVLMYIPNRIMDLTDIFSFSIGTGATAKLKMRCTHAIGFGAGIGPSASLVKTHDRRIGFALDSGYEIFCLGNGIVDEQREYTTGNLIDYWYYHKGMRWPGDPIFARDHAYDYWALEVEAAAFIDVKVAFHPLGLADFICGLFGYNEILQDDYELF